MNVTPSLSGRLAAVVLSLSATACVSHQHVVGLGGTGTGEQSARQYYALFGLLQLNDVATQRLAPDLTSYTIDTRFGWVDLFFTVVMLPIAGTTRTVTVRT